MRSAFLLVLCSPLVWPAAAVAQEKPEYILTHKQTKEKEGFDRSACVAACDKQAAKEKAKPPTPWIFKLRVGSVFQLNSNKSVIGQRDGTSRSIGGDIHAEANWTKNRHEVRNRGDVNVVFIKTPTSGGWVSATDLLELENIYQYRLLPWLGPFTRLGFITSLFVGRDLRTNSVQYQFPDGSLTGELTRLKLTGPLRPMTFLESFGMFVNPIREGFFDWDLRFGIGARQVIADGQLGVQDDDETTDIVEVVDLKSYAQAGFEFITMVRGEMFDKKLSYFFGGEFLLPVIRNREPGDNRSAVKLIDKKIRLGAAYRLASWATLLYEIRLVHQPQLLDEYQVQNAVGIKASYSVL